MGCINYNYGTVPKGTYKIIQGDTFQRTLCIRQRGGDKLECIKNVYFSCDYLNISMVLPIKVNPNTGKEEIGYYTLLLPADVTAKFPKCSTSYDITIDFGVVGSDTVIKTLRYQYPLEVLQKNNVVTQLS